MLSNLKLLYNLKELKSGVFDYFDTTSIENCWVHGDWKTVHLSASKDGKGFNSWGTSSNEVLAIGVALMELIERAHLALKPNLWTNVKTSEKASHEELSEEYESLTSFLSTSSGLAAHLNTKSAIQNSLSEIIERHVITKSALCNIGFEKIDNETFFSKGPCQQFVVIKRYRYLDQGYLYGTASSTNLADAVKSAENELAPQVAWSLNPANLDHLSTSFSLNAPSGIQFYNLNNNLDLKTCADAGVDTDLAESNFWYSEIKPLPSFKSIKSLRVTRAFSPKLQPFYFGRLLDGPINPLAFDGYNINPSREFNIVA